MYYDILYACTSHIGHVRQVNQDNYICNGCYMDDCLSPPAFPLTGCVTSKSPTLFGVLDGMGGEECGEIASLIAAKAAADTPLKGDAVSVLRHYCSHTNEAICTYADAHGISAMGTTAALLLFTKRSITLCNIGDSKIFRLSGGKLNQISTDHVIASSVHRKPPLSQNLGIPPQILLIDPYLSQGRYADADRYLICSDGLTDMLPTETIEYVLANTSPADAALQLTEQALQRGGKDNVTVLVLEIRRRSFSPFSIYKRKNGGATL